jgi:hypothetical protein
MKSIDFLYVALAAFFLIQGTYLAILIRDYVALGKQSKELRKAK